MTSKSVFLFNPWTEVTHGHARNELNIAKDFLLRNGRSAKILSCKANYGDINFEVQKSTFANLPIFLKRGYLFRHIKNQEQKIQVNNLAKILAKLACDYPLHLVVTSMKPNDLIHFENIQFRNFSMSIRVISPPETSREVAAFLNMNANKEIQIAFETKDGTTRAEELGGKNLLTVPPIQGIAHLLENASKKYVGIFWPVSYYEPEGEVRALLKQLSNQTCIIRLPGNVDKEKIIKDFPRNEYINRGISDTDFSHFVNKVNVAILPHKGYKLRGSGLAALFAGLGIPILTNKSNSFFADIDGKSEIRQISSNLLDDINIIKLETDKSKIEKKLYHDWTRLQWMKFFEENTGQ